MPIAHPKLKSVLDPVIALYDDVKRKCVLRLEYENKVKCEALTSPTSKFYQMPFEYAMSIYCYYVCFKCKKVCMFRIISVMLIQLSVVSHIMEVRQDVWNKLDWVTSLILVNWCAVDVQMLLKLRLCI